MGPGCGTDRATYEESGYHTVPQVAAGAGFVYPNSDADADLLIDGWERLLGTNAAIADTDCDGLSDGFEVRSYRSTGLPQNHGYRDPRMALAFPISDGFESGNTDRWPVATGLDDGVGFEEPGMNAMREWTGTRSRREENR